MITMYLKDADALAICTEWSIFRTPDFEKMKASDEEQQVIFDGRNLFDLEQMKDAGFYYNSIGQKNNSIDYEKGIGNRWCRVFGLPFM
jgi:UDPglucose 6-dehydrogenase